MNSPPRSIPPGTTLHRDASGRYYLHAGAPSYGGPAPYPAPPTMYGIPSPLLPSYAPPFTPSYGAPTAYAPSTYAPAAAYGAPPGHVLVPVGDLQHLISNQGSAVSPPHHSVHSMHPNGTVNDVSHSHPQLHASAAAPQTTIGAPPTGPQTYSRWSQ